MPTLTRMPMKDNKYVRSSIHLENKHISTMQTIAPEQSQIPVPPAITPETHIWLQIEGPNTVARTHALAARDRFEPQSSIS